MPASVRRSTIAYRQTDSAYWLHPFLSQVLFVPELRSFPSPPRPCPKPYALKFYPLKPKNLQELLNPKTHNPCFTLRCCPRH
jgi:hypothetical protein